MESDDYPDCFDDCRRDCEAVGGERDCICIYAGEVRPRLRSYRWLYIRFCVRHPILAVRGWIPF